MTDQEINIAVARKLGWTNLQLADDLPTRPELSGMREGSPPFGETVPDYCHSIEAAWEIVERMNSSCNVVSVHCEVKTFFVQFTNMGDIWNGPLAATAPMAITLAFLKLEEKI